MNQAHNPYTAPRTDVEDAHAPARKPLAIFLFQVLLALGVAFVVIDFGRIVWDIVKYSRNGPINFNGPWWIWIGWHLLLGGASTWTLFALQRRSIFSRWMTVVWLAVAIAGIVAIGPSLSVASESSAAMVGYFIGMALTASPFALLVYFSAFSRRARAYFGVGLRTPARS